MSVTRTGRPEMPDGYGVAEAGDFLEWEDVEARLRESIHYWLGTTRPDGRPHVVPRWGVRVDQKFWYDGSPSTRHSRNLESNPHCTLHLESGVEVTILEGISTVPDPVMGEMGERLSAEFIRKYGPLGYSPGPDSWSGEASGGLHVLAPASAIAWAQFPADLTRFSFD
jgi:hypothetical protein